MIPYPEAILKKFLKLMKLKVTTKKTLTKTRMVNRDQEVILEEWLQKFCICGTSYVFVHRDPRTRAGPRRKRKKLKFKDNTYVPGPKTQKNLAPTRTERSADQAVRGSLFVHLKLVLQPNDLMRKINATMISRVLNFMMVN